MNLAQIMKNKPLIIDSPNSKKPMHKIFGNLCGTKPKAKHFDDFHESSENQNLTLLPKETLSKIQIIIQKYPETDNSGESESYSLIEDLKIIFCKGAGLAYEKLMPNRSIPSIKSRYFKRLRAINNNEMRQILKYIEENGVENKSLAFQKIGGLQGIRDGGNMLLLDEKEDEDIEKIKEIRENEKEKNNEMEEENENEEKIYENEEKISSKVESDKEIQEKTSSQKEEHENLCPNLDSSNPSHIPMDDHHISSDVIEEEKDIFDRNLLDDIEKMDENIEKIDENIEKINEGVLEVETKEKPNALNICCRTLGILLDLNNSKMLPVLISKDQNDKINNSTKEQITIIKDFSSNQREFIKGVNSEVIKILLDLKSAFQKNIRVIVQDLHKVSGNLDDLIEYYTDEENREHILWNNDEDSVLEEAKTGKENSMKLLIKYKGLQRVKNRIKFKGIAKNFEL